MERAVQHTDFDALASKISALSTRYLPPPAELVAPGFSGYEESYMAYINSLRVASRRAYGKCKYSGSSYPVMNYGTYLRTMAIDQTISECLHKHSKLQIVNIGCGSDLRMITLLRDDKTASNVEKYIDVDYAESVGLKRQVLENSKALSPILEDQRYVLESCDLKNVQSTIDLLLKLTKPEIPTLVISECVLCYMPDKESQLLIDSVMDTYKEGEWVSYDPIGGSDPNDRFGKIMQQNLLESRQLQLPTLLKYNSCEKYASRWTQRSQSEFKKQIMDMWQYYSNSVPSQEKNRLKTLQFMDEIEELRVMQSHYVIFHCEWKN